MEPLKDAQEILVKILNEIDKIPLKRSVIEVVANEYSYGLLVELKRAHWLDFELIDTVPDSIPEDTDNAPFLKQKLYRIAISFRKEGDKIYIASPRNIYKAYDEDIKYYITEEWRQK